MTVLTVGDSLTYLSRRKQNGTRVFCVHGFLRDIVSHLGPVPRSDPHPGTNIFQ